MATSDIEVVEEIDEKITSVRTQNLDLSFNELVDMYVNDELIIHPDFQRMFRWSEGSQSRFIESLLLELPIPPIFLIEREDRIYELIDGLQRISTYLHFRGQLVVEGEHRGKLELSDCDIVEGLNGLTVDTLPRSLEIKLKRAFVRAEILRKESDPRLRYHMFKRLNTGGEILSAHEVRNATIRLLDSEFNDFLIEMSETGEFVTTIGAVAENQIRKKFDQELVLRFFAFKNDRASYRHDISDFLTEYMEEISDPEASRLSFDYESERAVFEKTFLILSKVSNELDYGGRIFGSVVAGSTEPRGQFSVYHFEGLTLGLQAVLDRVDADDPTTITALAAAVRTGKADRDFIDKTGAGKNDPNPLRERVDFFSSAFNDALS